jgi:MFS family permease
MLLTPMMLAMVSGSVSTGQVISRTGKYRTMGIAGLALGTVGMFMLTRLTVTSPGWWVVVSMLLLGYGVGVTMPLFTIALQAQFQDRIGEVTAGSQFFRSIGGTVGVALLGGTMNARFATELSSLVTRHSEKFGPLAGKLEELAKDPSALLNSGAMSAIAKAVPPQLKPVLVTFGHDVQTALATSISHTFLYGAVLLAIAFVVMFFLREIPLDARPSASAEAAAVELFEAEAVQSADAEIALVGNSGDSDKDRKDG